MVLGAALLAPPGLRPLFAMLLQVLALCVVGGEPECPPGIQACFMEKAGVPFGDGYLSISGKGNALGEESRAALCRPGNWASYESCYDTCALRLQITEPAEYATEFCVNDMAFAPYNVGSHISATHPLNNVPLEIVAPGAPDLNFLTGIEIWGCYASDFATKDYTNKLVLTVDVGCWFYEKFQHMFAVGAAASIMIHTSVSNTFTSQLMDSDYWADGTSPQIPTGIIPRQYGQLLMEALGTGKKVMGTFKFNCNAEQSANPLEVPMDSPFRLCPSTRLIEMCDAEKDPAERLCAFCPLSFAALSGTKQVCLWGNELYPSKAATLLFGGKAVAGVRESLVMLTELAGGGCVETDFAGLAGEVVVLPMTTRCTPFSSVRIAQKMGVAGYVMQNQRSQVMTESIEGLSQFVDIPVHVIGPNDWSTATSLSAQGTAVEHLGRIIGHRVEGRMVSGIPDTTPWADDGDGVEILPQSVLELDERSEFEMSATLIVAPAIALLLVAVLAGIVYKQKASRASSVSDSADSDESSNGLDATKKPFSIPLGVASMGLSITLLLSIGVAAFSLAHTSGQRAADTGVSNGQTASDNMYSNAVDNVDELGRKLRLSAIDAILLGLNDLLNTGEHVAESITGLYLDLDSTWDSFEARHKTFIDLLHRIKAEHGTKWRPKVMTTSYFYADSYISTDNRPDAFRTDTNPHVSLTNNGSLYGYLGYFYDPENGVNIPTAQAAPIGAGPMERLGGWPGNPMALTEGKAVASMTWHITTQTTPYTWNPAELIFVRQPLGVYTPLYSRTRQYLGTVAAEFPMAGVSTMVQSALKGQSQIEVVIFDRIAATVISATAHGSEKLVGSTSLSGYKTLTRSFTLHDIPPVEINALASVLLEEQAARIARGSNDTYLTSDYSGEFEQSQFYDRSKSFLALHLTAVQGADTASVSSPLNRHSILDQSGNMFRVKLDGANQRPVTEEGGRALINLDGATTLLVDQNLTTNIPEVKVLMNRNHPLFESVVEIGRDESNKAIECVAKMDPVTQQNFCILREPFTTASHTIAAEVWPAVHVAAADSTPRIFSDTRSGEAIVRFYANGALKVNVLEYGCVTAPLPTGLPARQWTSLAAVVDRERRLCSVYVNGTLHATGAITLLTTQQSRAEPYTVGQNFHGKLSYVSVYNITLTPNEVHGLHTNTGAFEREVPEKRWFVDVAAFERNNNMQEGISFSVAAMIPRQSIMREVDENNAETKEYLRIQETNTLRQLQQESVESVLIIVVIGLFAVILFLVFNEMLTRPFTSVAQVMADAAVMRICEVPKPTTPIAELNIMYESMNTMMNNLDSFRPFLPEALFENTAFDKSLDDTDIPGAKSGKAALVFTDIKSSTATWEACPEGMKEGLAVHNQVIRKLIFDHGGYEVKTIGDAFMIAFESPVAAVTFALAVHERLYGATWPVALLDVPQCAREAGAWHGLRLRIGVNYGDVEVTPNPISQRFDYFGNTVNKAARAESSTVAGTVGVTPDVFTCLDDSVLDTAVVVSLGNITMRGVSKPVELRALFPKTLKNRQTYVTNEMRSGQKPEENKPVSQRSYTASEASRSQNLPRAKAPKNELNIKALNEAGGRQRAGTIVRVEFRLEGGNMTTPSEQSLSRVNEVLSTVLSHLQATQGTVVAVLATSATIGWNVSRTCAPHIESSFRCVGHIQSEYGRFGGCSRQAGVDMFVGISSGNVLCGNISAGGQKFIAAIGGTVTLATLLAESAMDMGVFALHASVLPLGSPALAVLDIKHSLRPVDEWTIASPAIISSTSHPTDSTQLTRVRVYEVGAHRYTDDPEWGWSDEYWDAYAKGDAAGIETAAPNDTVLKGVVTRLHTNKALRAPLNSFLLSA